MKALIQKMNIMLDSVGKNVLSKENPKEYEDVIYKQEILGFCDTLIQTFKWDRNELKGDFNKRKDFITRLLECLLELNEKNLLDNFILSVNNEGEDKFSEFINIFNKHKIHFPSEIRFMNDLNNKISILSNEQNREAIIETMVKIEYFTRLSKN